MDWCMYPCLWTYERSTLCPQGERAASASRLLRAQSARGSICDVISECKWQSVGRLHICDSTATAVVGSDICWIQMTSVSGSACITFCTLMQRRLRVKACWCGRKTKNNVFYLKCLCILECLFLVSCLFVYKEHLFPPTRTSYFLVAGINILIKDSLFWQYDPGSMTKGRWPPP